MCVCACCWGRRCSVLASTLQLVCSGVCGGWVDDGACCDMWRAECGNMLLLACYETRRCECCCWHRSKSVCWPAKAAAWHLPFTYTRACAAVDIHSLSRPPVTPPSLPQLHPDASKLNISHTIHELRFGPRFPGQVSRGFLLRFAALLGVSAAVCSLARCPWYRGATVLCITCIMCVRHRFNNGEEVKGLV
jgi:hypothetical protein